jgi:hypothetical protein
MKIQFLSRNLSFFIFLSLFFYPRFCQAQKTSIADSSQIAEVYSIIQFVVKAEKLDKKCGFRVKPEPDCSPDKQDFNYLYSLQIRSAKPTKPALDSTGNTVVNEFGQPDKNIFTKADISYILKTKNKFKSFTWDNHLLGFDWNNKWDFYSFSVPYFNLAHTKVILMYEFHCPGLCGNGKTIVLTKSGDQWSISAMERWVH